MKHIKLFETFILKNTDESEKVYQNSLDDSYWKDISDKFPNYNSSNSNDCKKAVNYIYKNIKEKYPEYNWKSIGKKVKDKIHSSIT